MIRLSVLSIFALVTATPQANAGAWLRTAGEGFLSSSGTVSAEKDATGSLYAEYGLTERFTLGLDINGGMDQAGIPSGDGTIFLRFPLSAPDAPQKWAAHVGIGARYEPREFYPSVEFGLSWGRGLQWRDQYGWAALDATINLAKAPMETITKLDATVGMGLSPHTKVMGQVFLTHTNRTLFTTLAPSLLFTPLDSRTTYQIGFEYPLQDEDEPMLKLGIWRQF